MSKPTINIDALSAAERLSLIEELWDSLENTPTDVPLTDAQRDELDRRIDDLERDGPIGIPWEALGPNTVENNVEVNNLGGIDAVFQEKLTATEKQYFVGFPG